MHNCSSIKGMATKFQSKTNINNIRNMTCHFLDNDAMPKNSENFRKYQKTNLFRGEQKKSNYFKTVCQVVH